MTDMNPEVAAQLEQQKQNCIFCKIISGAMQGKNVYDDNLMSGILDINPCTKGHTLIMPKEHYPIMPLLPPETFKHIFGKMPAIVGALKNAMLTTGLNILIANGGVAGQQSPHFLFHLLPREAGDNLDKYSFDMPGPIDEKKATEINSMLGNNLPIMMNNHFGRNPATWRKGDIHTIPYIEAIEGTKIYEDEKVTVFIPKIQMCIGHLVVYSNEEEFEFENLSEESGSHLFYTASFAATAVFEGMGAHGSNIILKTGTSNL